MSLLKEGLKVLAGPFQEALNLSLTYIIGDLHT